MDHPLSPVFGYAGEPFDAALLLCSDRLMCPSLHLNRTLMVSDKQNDLYLCNSVPLYLSPNETRSDRDGSTAAPASHARGSYGTGTSSHTHSSAGDNVFDRLRNKLTESEQRRQAEAMAASGRHPFSSRRHSQDREAAALAQQQQQQSGAAATSAAAAHSSSGPGSHG